MAERQTTASETDELRRTVQEQQEEILRLRDLLVGKDVELGVAKGRAAELEDRWKRLAGAKKRVESGVPVLGKLLGLVLRLLRGRP
jgi:hypothetical protein